MSEMAEKLSWLDAVTEEIIDPGLPIVDPHHHLWNRPEYKPYTRYFLDELLEDTGSGHNVVATVYVECRSNYREDGPEHLRSVGETEFVEGVAAENESRDGGRTRVGNGIVGNADLTLGAGVAEVLEAHLAASPKRFRGIRHIVAWDDDPEAHSSAAYGSSDLLTNEDFRAGIACLGEHNLSFDAWLYFHQIPALADLARAHPGVTIVLNHLGGPLGIGVYTDKRDEVFSVWKKNIAEIAQCENVVAKLGGINMTINGFGWHQRAVPPGSEELATATRDYYLHAIDCFGPERCMFESNFPVDKISCSYAVLWNSFKRIAEGFSDNEKAALFHDTAARVYRLSK